MSSHNTAISVGELTFPLQDCTSTPDYFRFDLPGHKNDPTTTLMQSQVTKKRKQPSSPSYDSRSPPPKKARSAQPVRSKARRCMSSSCPSSLPVSYRSQGQKRQASECIGETASKRIKSISLQEIEQESTTNNSNLRTVSIGPDFKDHSYTHHLTEGALLQLCQQNFEQEPPSEDVCVHYLVSR